MLNTKDLEKLNHDEIKDNNESIQDRKISQISQISTIQKSKSNSNLQDQS